MLILAYPYAKNVQVKGDLTSHEKGVVTDHSS